MIALLALACTSVSAGSKKDKKKAQPAEAPVQLVSGIDSLSFAHGVDQTNGLLPFLKQEYQFDESKLEDFVRGYKDYLNEPKTPEQNAYNAGRSIAEMVVKRFIPSRERALGEGGVKMDEQKFHQGFLAAIHGDTTYFDQKAASNYVREKQQAITERANEANKKAGEDFLAANKAKAGVVVLPSGLQYRVITAGKGDMPKADDEVEVVYEGKTVDGTVFDATERHNGAKTDKFRVNQLIKGWTEALQLMPVGSKWELFIPQELGYGPRAAGQIKPYSALVFTMELKGIVPKAQPEAEAAEATAVTPAPAKKQAEVKPAAKKSAKAKSKKK